MSMIVNVQALRALAAFLVVFVHLQAIADRLGWSLRAFEFGNAGVDIFFVISGMIMVLTTSRAAVTPAAFLRNRIARIVPFYWLVTLLVFGLAMAAPALFQGTQITLAALVKSLSFVPFARADGKPLPIVFVGWTLNYEMAFYMVFAAGLTIRNRGLGRLLTIAALVTVVATALLLRPTGLLARFYSAPIMLEFALGMLIGSLAHRLPVRTSFRPIVLLAGLAALILLVLGPTLWPTADRFANAGLPGAALVLCAVYLEKTGWVLKSCWAVVLGDASFATYLTHFFVTQLVVRAVEWLRVSAPPTLLLALVLAFVLVAVTGVLVHRYVEWPLSRAAKKILTPRHPAIPDRLPAAGSKALAEVERSDAAEGAF
jgi:peptidoglycan/LPS O-acetylase OafA/YrhL